MHQSSIPSPAPSLRSDPMSSSLAYSSPTNNTVPNSKPQSSRINSSTPPERSTRAKAPPLWLQDYIYLKATNSKSMAQSVSTSQTTASHNLPTTHRPNSTPYPLFLPTDLAHLSSSYVALLVNVLQIPEPSCYAHAKLYPE